MRINGLATMWISKFDEATIWNGGLLKLECHDRVEPKERPGPKCRTFKQSRDHPFPNVATLVHVKAVVEYRCTWTSRQSMRRKRASTPKTTVEAMKSFSILP